MKRFHVHVSVDNIPKAVKFYSQMFGEQPTVEKTDYAKWMLADPRVNFAISARGRAAGLDHLGIQVENKEELKEVYGRMENAGQLLPQGETTCCYAKSEKSWVHDPQGIAWEAFHTTGEATVYGEGEMPAGEGSACCVPLAPSAEKEAACCVPSAAKGDTTATGGSCC